MPSTNYCLVLIALDKCKALDFVKVVYKLALASYYHHHTNYKYLILMEDGAPMHCNNAPKLWQEYIGIRKILSLENSLNLNPLENLWKVCKDRFQNMVQPIN